MEKLYLKFVIWKARPIQKTDPQNQTEFCERYKIKMSDLKEFLDRPEFPEDLLTATIGWAKSKTPELIQAIYDDVKVSHNVSDLERFLNVIHEIKRKDKVNNQQINFFNSLTPEQYESIVIREARVLAPGSNK